MKKIEAEADTTHNTVLRMISHDFSIFPGVNSVPPRQLFFSTEFDAHNSSRCSCPFYFVLFGIFLQFIYSINHGTLRLRITKRFRGCEASSEDFNQKIAMTEWTKTYEAMITTATCLRDNCNGK